MVKSCYIMIIYDLYGITFYLSNTGYVEIVNNFEKNYNSKYLHKQLLKTFDRYFIDDVGQSPIIVHYDNYSKLTTAENVEVVLYIKNKQWRFLSGK